MSMQPLKIYGHWGGPNPWKVRIILNELGIPYEWEVVEFSDVKKEAYLQVNPNGRLPTMVDPNTDMTIWESGAIIQYLVDQHDTSNKISFSTTREKYLAIQWLAFQISGQGPYLGQATWFVRFHPEKLPSAIDRFVKEMERVFGVLDRALQGKNWLVGDKCSYADLAFVTWSETGMGLFAQLDMGSVVDKYPNFARWSNNLKRRDSVKGALEQIAAERKAHGLPP